ncbi:MAG: serine hydrolase domain-containing protein [Pseudomonadota bacterium]
MLEHSALDDRLGALLQTLGAQKDLPGFAVSVRLNDREVFAKGYGTRDPGRMHPVTQDTLFGVASVTKVLTATLIMVARKAGLVRLSDPLSRFYPDLDCARDGQIRIQHVMSHSAGLPGLPFRHQATRAPSDTDSAPLLTPADLVAAMNARDFDCLSAPGERVSYSNECFCLLGGIIETLFECSFAEAAERFVMGPLAMERSVIGAPATAAFTDIAVPLQQKGDGLQACGFWDAPLFDAAGGLVASARDVSRLIQVLDSSAGVLGADEVREMMSLRLPVASRPNSASFYGLGLEITALDAGHDLMWHTGQRPGISSFVGHVPQSRLSVAFVTNIADAPSASIGHQIVADVLGDDLNIEEFGWPFQVVEGEADAPERFCGAYSSLEIPSLAVQVDDGELMLRRGANQHPLRFVGPNHGIVGGQTFCFLGSVGPLAPGQQAQSLALDLRILPRHAPA